METPWTYNAPLGHRVLESCTRGGRGLSLRANRMLVLVLTFLCYAAYHASRKPPSIVKSVLHGDGGTNGESGSAFIAGGHRRRRRSLLEEIEVAVETQSALEWTHASGSSSSPQYMQPSTTLGGLGKGKRSLLEVTKKHSNHSGGGVSSGASPDGMSDSERALLERRVAQLAEERGGMVPARVAASMEAHHYLHPPHGRHGMMAMGSTLVIMNEKRESVEGSEDEDYYDDREALLGGISPSSTAGAGASRAARGGRRGGAHGRGSVSFLAAWCIPGVAVYAFTLFFAKLTAYTFLYWLPYYINSTEVGGERLTPTQAGNLSILFDVGGVLGGVLAGYFSDASNSPAIVSCSFVYLAIPTLWLYRSYGAISFTLNISLMMAAGFFVNGPYALITTAVSADLGSSSTVGGNEKALATVTAIIDGMGSIGAALGPMVTGYISELPGGFDNVFYMLYGAGLCAGLLLSCLVLRELGELLGIGNGGGKNSSGAGGASGKRGGGGDGDRVGQYGPVLAPGDVVNSAQFAYNPPDQVGGSSGDMMIDNERGLLRTSATAGAGRK